MRDALEGMGRVPKGLNLAQVTARAIAGDATARHYLISQGLYDAIDVWHPGTGGAVKKAVDAVHDLISGKDPNVIDGEYRVIDGARYRPFVDWAKSQTWGVWDFLGPKGTGKTTSAMTLAHGWNQRRQTIVEGVNIYPDTSLPYLKTITIGTLEKRLDKLNKFLGVDEDERDAADSRGSDGFDAAFWAQAWGEEDKLVEAHELPFYDRVVIFDELSLSVGNSGTDKGRRIVRAFMAQARHLRWNVIYIGQLARMMPLDLLLAEAVFVKRPDGREIEADRQDALTRELWTSATEGFKCLKDEPFRERYPDIRSWSFVDCRSMGGPRGFRGLVPFGRVQAT